MDGSVKQGKAIKNNYAKWQAWLPYQSDANRKSNTLHEPTMHLIPKSSTFIKYYEEPTWCCFLISSPHFWYLIYPKIHEKHPALDHINQNDPTFETPVSLIGTESLLLDVVRRLIDLSAPELILLSLRVQEGSGGKWAEAWADKLYFLSALDTMVKKDSFIPEKTAMLVSTVDHIIFAAMSLGISSVRGLYSFECTNTNIDAMQTLFRS